MNKIKNPSKISKIPQIKYLLIEGLNSFLFILKHPMVLNNKNRKEEEKNVIVISQAFSEYLHVLYQQFPYQQVPHIFLL